MKSKPLTVSFDRCHELFIVKSPDSQKLETESGLVWRAVRRGPIKTDSWAGSLSFTLKGYKNWLVGIDSKLYLVSRIIYFMTYKIDPYPFEVDHIDRNSLNNIVTNLRLADRRVQNLNTEVRKDSNTGIKGVHWDKSRSKWAPYVKANNKKIYLGRYDFLYDACAARNKAVLKYYPPETHEANLIDLSALDKVSRSSTKT